MGDRPSPETGAFEKPEAYKLLLSSKGKPPIWFDPGIKRFTTPWLSIFCNYCMDILDKAYDYIDYTLEQLAKTGESSVSLLYFFKLFSPAGKLAKQILTEHSFIKMDDNDVPAITERGRDVVTIGGIRKYLAYLDEQSLDNEQRLKRMRKILIGVACAAGSAIVLMMLKNRMAG